MRSKVPSMAEKRSLAVERGLDLQSGGVFLSQGEGLGRKVGEDHFAHSFELRRRAKDQSPLNRLRHQGCGGLGESVLSL